MDTPPDPSIKSEPDTSTTPSAEPGIWPPPLLNDPNIPESKPPFWNRVRDFVRTQRHYPVGFYLALLGIALHQGLCPNHHDLDPSCSTYWPPRELIFVAVLMIIGALLSLIQIWCGMFRGRKWRFAFGTIAIVLAIAYLNANIDDPWSLWGIPGYIYIAIYGPTHTCCGGVANTVNS